MPLTKTGYKTLCVNKAATNYSTGLLLMIWDTRKVDEWILKSTRPHTNRLLYNIYLVCKTFLPPLKWSVGQGNVFTRICYSVHRGEGVSIWTETLHPLPPERPPGQKPPSTQIGTLHTWTERLPDRDLPWTETPPWIETPMDRDHLDRETTGQRPPMDREPPWTETLYGQKPPDKDPHGQRLLWIVKFEMYNNFK